MDLNNMDKRNQKGQFIKGNTLSEEHKGNIGIALRRKKRPIEVGRKISI